MKCGKINCRFARNLLILIVVAVLGTILMPMQTAAASKTDKKLEDIRKVQKRTGKWVRKENQYKFLYKNGNYALNAWVNIRGNIYYIDKNGFRAVGWKTYLGRRYYFNKEGCLQTRWVNIGKKRYYFNSVTGAMRTGWYLYRGQYYYFQANGRMQTGWLTLNKKKYYLQSDGTRAVGDLFIKNKWCRFSSSGVYNPSAKVTPKVDPKKPMVALTFDDGPGPYTDRLLDCIQKYKARVTFFMVGASVPRYPNTVKRAYNLKCEIGNHTYAHPQLSYLPDYQILDQLNSTNQVIKSITNHNTDLLRPPYGDYNSRVTSLAGTPVIMWSIDTLDWKTLNTQSTVNSVLNNVKDGDIVLMHDIHQPTVAAAEIIIPALLNRGYQLVTVSELGAYKRGGLADGVVYSSIR